MSTSTTAARKLAITIVSAFALLAGLFVAPAQATPASDINVYFSPAAGPDWEVTVVSDKGLSNLVFRYGGSSELTCLEDPDAVDAPKIEFPGDYGQTWTGTVAGTYMGKALCGVFVKSGNNNSSYGPGYGEFISVNDWIFVLPA